MKPSLARAWMVLSVVALLISGLLALVITAAKVPGFKNLVQDLDLIRWCLVVHVNLATLVWFTAIPASLIHLSIQTLPRSPVRRIGWLGFALAVAGVLMMMSVPPQEGLEIVLANYIPVLAHPRYYSALVVYLVGVLLNYLPPFFSRRQATSTWPGLAELRVGLAAGAGFFTLALAALALAFIELRQTPNLSTKDFFEAGMWGGGHLLQHASAVFLVCAWIVLLSAGKFGVSFSRRQIYAVFSLFALPLSIAPFLLSFSIFNPLYREGFTYLMRFGIAPGALLAIFFLRKSSACVTGIPRFKVTATFLSAFLLTLGFVFGAMIRGTDLRIPGHYHAEIGAVTLAFMALSFQVLANDRVNRWMMRTVWTYGVGQTFFAGGMFIAGVYGIGRKTYGTEHHLTNWGQGTGFAMMAIGGLAAFAGGLFYALAIKNHLRQNLRSSVTNSSRNAVFDSFEVTKGFIKTNRSINQ